MMPVPKNLQERMFVSCRFLLRQMLISCEMEQERPLHETMSSDPLEIMSCACEDCLQSGHQGWLCTSLTFKVTRGAKGEGGNQTRVAVVPGVKLHGMILNTMHHKILVCVQKLACWLRLSY